MKVLFVAPYLPTHGSGGRTRLVNLAERVARDHEVRVIGFIWLDQRAEDNPYPGRSVPPPPTRPRPGGWRGRLQFWRERLERQPAFASDMRSDEMARAIAEEVADFQPDVVQVETTEMAQYLRAIPSGPLRVLDLQDVATGWFKRNVGRAPGVRARALVAWEYFRTRRYDREHQRLADVVLVSSDSERAIVHATSGVEAAVVPNGVDTEVFVPLDRPEDDRRLLFIGPMAYVANLEGMRWFAREVWPSIHAAEPDLRLDMVGRPQEGEQWPSAFDVHGRVEDVREYLASTALSIVPLFIGSGTRYKILEGLSMGRAIVSTSIGAEGLDLQSRTHLLIADEPADFAAAVLELVGDASLRRALGEAGREHVRSRYDWGPIVATMLDAWGQALGRRASTSQE